MSGVLVGTFCGKEIYAVQTMKYSKNQLNRFFSKLDRNITLREICSLSHNVTFRTQHGTFGSVAYTHDSLCVATQLICKYSAGTQIPDGSIIETILKIAHSEIDRKLTGNGNSPSSIMMQISYAQFEEDPLHNIARTWALYKYVWPTVQTNTDPLQEIEQIVGVPYKLILYFGVYATKKEGHFFEIDDASLKPLFNKAGLIFQANSHSIFLDWISTDCTTWIKYSVPPYYKKRPLLKSNVLLNNCNRTVYFVPSAYNVLDRVTRGIYFDIADKFNNGEKNLFKIDYGNVFEKYIGLLFEKFLKDCKVYSEIEYGSKRERKKSIDYFILKNNLLILIEVKQSSIFAKTKYNPKQEILEKDLDENPSKAVSQLNKTERIILDKMHDEFKMFFDVRKILKIAVFCDSLQNANNICKEILKKKSKESSDSFSNIEFMNIEDLETILEYQHKTQNFVELMFEKNEKYSTYDFNEFFCEKNGSADCNKMFLKKYFNDILDLDKEPKNEMV